MDVFRRIFCLSSPYSEPDQMSVFLECCNIVGFSSGVVYIFCVGCLPVRDAKNTPLLSCSCVGVPYTFLLHGKTKISRRQVKDCSAYHDIMIYTQKNIRVLVVYHIHHIQQQYNSTVVVVNSLSSVQVVQSILFIRSSS